MTDRPIYEHCSRLIDGTLYRVSPDTVVLSRCLDNLSKALFSFRDTVDKRLGDDSCPPWAYDIIAELRSVVSMLQRSLPNP